MDKIVILFLALAAVAVLLGLSVMEEQPVACTMEAKLCPDGSYVGRTGPDCEFSSCPYDYCSGFSVESCPSQCVICPPCEVCSSIACRSEQFCNSIGFDRSWWESVRPK